MKYSIFILFLISNQSLMAENQLTLRIDENEIVNVSLLDQHEFEKLSNELKLISNKPFKNSVTRIFKSRDNSFICELFNGKAIKIQSEDYEEVFEVAEFVRVPFSSMENEVSYIIDIRQEYFKKLNREIVEKVENRWLHFLFDIYQLKNGELLVEWKIKSRNTKFSIFQNLRTLIAIDPELVNEIDEEKNSSPKPWMRIIENTKYEKVKFNQVKARLSNILNFAEENLDFSMESVDIIENSISWNIDKISKWELNELCYVYLGELVRRKLNLNWIEIEGDLYLRDENFKFVDFGFKLQDSITQTDYPSIKWVVEDALTKKN